MGNIEVGNTKIVADYISEITGADQYEIVTHKYDGMAYMPLIDLAKKEANKGELPPYEGAAPDLKASCPPTKALPPTSASTTPSSSAAPCGGAPVNDVRSTPVAHLLMTFAPLRSRTSHR